MDFNYNENQKIDLRNFDVSSISCVLDETHMWITALWNIDEESGTKSRKFRYYVFQKNFGK